jgi:hypothetical protein
MAGAIVIIVVLLIVPVLVLLSGGLASAILGQSLAVDGEQRDEDSELHELPD